MDISLNYRFLVKYWKWTALSFLSCMSVVWLAGFWMIDFIKCWAWPIEQNSSRVRSYTYSIHVVDHDLPRLTTLAQPALEITMLWSVLRLKNFPRLNNSQIGRTNDSEVTLITFLAQQWRSHKRENQNQFIVWEKTMLKYLLIILFAAWLRRFGLALGLFESVIPKDGFQFEISSRSYWLSQEFDWKLL